VDKDISSFSRPAWRFRSRKGGKKKKEKEEKKQRREEKRDYDEGSPLISG